MQKSVILLIWSIATLIALASIGIAAHSQAYLNHLAAYWEIVVFVTTPASFIGALFTGIYQNQKPGTTFRSAGLLSLAAAFVGFILGVVQLTNPWALACNLGAGILIGVVGMQKIFSKAQSAFAI